MSFDFFFWRRWEMSQLKEDQLISQPAPCSSNSWAVMGRENVIAEPPTPPLPMLYWLHSCDGSHRYLYSINFLQHVQLYIEHTYIAMPCVWWMSPLCHRRPTFPHGWMDASYATNLSEEISQNWTQITRICNLSYIIYIIYRKLIFGHT